MTQISFRIDEKIKKDAEKVCEEIGMSMSTAITIYLKKLGKEKRIPFELSADSFYSEKNVNYLLDVMEDVKNGKAKFSKHKLVEDKWWSYYGKIEPGKIISIGKVKIRNL